MLVAGLKFHEMILGHPSTMVEYPTFLPMGTPWSPGQNRWPRLHCGQAPKEFDIAQPVVVTKVPQQYVIAGRQADDGRARTAAGKRKKERDARHVVLLGFRGTALCPPGPPRATPTDYWLVRWFDHSILGTARCVGAQPRFRTRFQQCGRCESWGISRCD